MAFGDANNDGKMDVAIADHCHGVFVYLGDGAGHWKNASAGLPTVGSEDVTVGDFNGDGCLDVAVVAAAEEGVRVFDGNCKGVWKESSKGLPHSEWGQLNRRRRHGWRRQPRPRCCLFRRPPHVAG